MALILKEEDAKDCVYKGEGAANLVLSYNGSSPSLVNLLVGSCIDFPVGRFILKQIIFNNELMKASIERNGFINSPCNWRF